MRWLVVAIIFLLFATPIGSRSFAQNGSWYYCTATRQYYPYTPRCPVPWQPVKPSNSGVPANLPASAPPTVLGSLDDTLSPGCAGLGITTPNTRMCQQPAPELDDKRNSGANTADEKTAGDNAYNRCLTITPSSLPGSAFTYDSPQWASARQQWRAKCDQAERDAVLQFRAQAEARAAANSVVDEQSRAIEKAKSRGYELIPSVKDLILDGKELAARNAKVQITGVYRKMGNNGVLYGSADEAYSNTDNYIPVLTDDAARSVREALMNYACQTNFGCEVEVGGHMTMCQHLNLLQKDYPNVPCLNIEVQIVYRPGD